MQRGSLALIFLEILQTVLFSRSFLHEIGTYNVTVEEILDCIFEIDLNDSLVKEVIKR